MVNIYSSDGWKKKEHDMQTGVMQWHMDCNVEARIRTKNF